MIADDELGVILRSADPATTPAGQPLTLAQLELRDRITAGRRPSDPVRGRAPRRVWALVLTPLAALTVVAIFVLSILPSAPATAQTPRPLALTNVSATAEEVVAMARQRLLRSAPEPAVRSVSSTGWYLAIDQSASGERTATINPQVTRITWDADRSGRILVVAGEPYLADGGDPAPYASDAPPAGTVLQDMVFAAGEMQVPPVEPTGGSVDEVRALLEGLGMPPEADAGSIMDAISSAFSWWTLSDAQHAGLLELLADRGGLEVLGAGEDRVGRPVTAVTADSAAHPDIRNILLISADTGRIVGMESVRVTADGDIPAGSVIAYTSWETPS
jgi:hypothetical protein